MISSLRLTFWYAGGGYSVILSHPPRGRLKAGHAIIICIVKTSLL